MSIINVYLKGIYINANEYSDIGCGHSIAYYLLKHSKINTCSVDKCDNSYLVLFFLFQSGMLQ